MDTNNNTPNQTPDVQSSSESRVSPANREGMKKILKFGLLVIILAAALYGGQKLYEKYDTSKYGLAEIDNLDAEQQRKVLEEQLKDYQERAAGLPEGSSTSERYAVYVKLAEIQNRLGMYREAIASIDKIAEERQGTSRIWGLYAQSYVGLGDSKVLVLENIKKALAIDDQSGEYWKIYIDASQDLPAEELDKLYTEAVAKTNNELEIVKSYARFLEKTGNKEKAIGYWETARNINPDGIVEYDAEIARLRN